MFELLLDVVVYCVFFFQAEDGIRDLVRSRGLGDVYKRQVIDVVMKEQSELMDEIQVVAFGKQKKESIISSITLSLIHI